MFYFSVDKAKKNLSGKMILDKHQYCYFCKQPVLKLSRHLLETAEHKKEKKVIRLKCLQENDRTYSEYMKELKRLPCLGNFQHNIEVLGKGESNVVVVKRPLEGQELITLFTMSTLLRVLLDR